jgi:YihY family inner membrane protein
VNPIEKVVRRIDAFQQRHTATSVTFGVMKKFGDDNAGTLVTNLAYSAFVALFPLLLVLVTVLGLVLADNPSARTTILNSTLSQFPLIGQQLGHNVHSLHRSSMVGLVIGLVGLVWGSTGLAQSGLFAMAQIWNLPGPDRPNFVKRLGRSGLFLAVLGVGVLVTTAVASFGTFGRHNVALGGLAEVVAVAVNIGVFFLAFRVLTPKAVETRRLWPGAVIGGVGWTILQAVGGYLVGHDLRNDGALYGTFGLVLGLLAFVYLSAELTIYAAEVNTVLADRLWPRGMVQPPLTEADQRSMAYQATQNQRRPEQDVSVDFTEPAEGQGEWLERQDHESDARSTR